MSLRERKSYLGPIHQSLTRSHSFGGLLMTPGGRRSLVGSTLRTGWSGMSVLGQGTPHSPSDLRRLNSLPPHVKVPKAPRPQRTSVVAGAASKGVKECLSVTRNDLEALSKAQFDYKMAKSQGRVYEMEKQIKAAERYLKRLEFLLSQIEDLHDQYSLTQRLREGVRTMAYAYSLSPGKEKASALNNVRSGYKECTETLCNLEVQIEQLIGTITLEMKGIQGFARLCPGDVFEVVIKHGTQKWKTKGRVAKDNSQIWDNPFYVFKLLLGEMLVVKAMEVRLLGKTVMIGNKACETKDFCSPHPQLMTVNLNPSGSLKLNVVLTWNPLDGRSDEKLVRTPTLLGSSSRGSQHSIIHSISSSPPPSTASFNSSSKDIHMVPDYDRDSSFGSMSARSSTADSASPMSEYRGLSFSQALSIRTSCSSPVSESNVQDIDHSRHTDCHDAISFDGRDSASPQSDETGNFTLVRKEESSIEQWARYSQYNTSQASSLDKISHSYSNLVTSYTPHSPGSLSQRLSPAHSPGSLAKKLSAAQSPLSLTLAHNLNLLSTIEKEDRPSSNSVTMTWDFAIPTSLPKVVSKLRSCLEDIQGQYSQLHSLEEAVLDLHDLCRQCQSRRDSNTSEISLSVESALECFDFLNAECDDDFGDDNPEECLAKNRKESLVVRNVKDLPDCSTKVVTTSPQLDAFLLVHLQYSLHLLQDLGSFGPLRRKEKESLKKLEREGKLLAVVLSHRHNFDSLKPQHIMPIPHVQVLWDLVATADEWCIVGKSVLEGLQPIVFSLVEPQSEKMATNVLEELVKQMTDSDIYSDCITVTAGHFLSTLIRPLQEIVPEICAGLSCASYLSQMDVKSVEKGLPHMKNASILQTKMISQLLTRPQEFSSLVLEFLNKNKNNITLLASLYDGTMLLLESTNPNDRSSAVKLLGHIFSLQPYIDDIFIQKRQITVSELKESCNCKIIDKKAKDESNKDQKINYEKMSESSYQNCDECASQNLLNEELVSNQNKVIKTSQSEPKCYSENIYCSADQACSPIPEEEVAITKRDSEVPLSILVLSFILQNDPSEAVRQSAKLSLLNMGSLGQDALHQVQLSSNGFQGIHVRDKNKGLKYNV